MNVRDIEISVADRALNATVFSHDAEEGIPGILCLPGYKSQRQLYYGHGSALAQELQVTCLTVDISGHGETPGDLYELTAQDLYDDALAAYDTLADQAGVDSDRIGIAGTSFGARLAVQLTRDRSPESLLLRAPAIKEELPVIPEQSETPVVKQGFFDRLLGRPPSLADVMEAALSTGDADARLRARLPSDGILKMIADYSGTITIVESEHDPHIAPAYIAACLAVARHSTHLVIPGAEHMLKGKEHLVYRRMLLEWAKEL